MGPVKLVERKQGHLWNIKIECPLTLGCQYFVEKIGDHLYIANQYDQNKQQAVQKASLEAIDVIMNDYDLK